MMNNMPNFNGMNPIQLFMQLSSAKDPMQAMSNLLGGNNTMLQQAMNMVQGKSQSEITETINNVCRTKGIDINQAKQFASMLGIKF